MYPNITINNHPPPHQQQKYDENMVEKIEHKGDKEEEPGQE